MANLTALNALDNFVKTPTLINASALIDIPTLHDVLLYEFATGKPVSSDVLDVCRWIVDRGNFILDWLREGHELLELAGISSEKPWTDVGAARYISSLHRLSSYFLDWMLLRYGKDSREAGVPQAQARHSTGSRWKERGKMLKILLPIWREEAYRRDNVCLVHP
jgi:hypothetical protein